MTGGVQAMGSMSYRYVVFVYIAINFASFLFQFCYTVFIPIDAHCANHRARGRVY